MFLEMLVLGDFQGFKQREAGVLEGTGLDAVELGRRVKIQAIPRLLSSNSSAVKLVSYDQLGQLL